MIMIDALYFTLRNGGSKYDIFIEHDGKYFLNLHIHCYPKRACTAKD